MRYRGEELHHMSIRELGQALVDLDETDRIALDILDHLYNRLAEREEIPSLGDDDFGVICRGLWYFLMEGYQGQRSYAIDCLSAVLVFARGHHADLIRKWVASGGIKYGPLSHDAPRPEPEPAEVK